MKREKTRLQTLTVTLAVLVGFVLSRLSPHLWALSSGFSIPSTLRRVGASARTPGCWCGSVFSSGEPSWPSSRTRKSADAVGLAEEAPPATKEDEYMLRLEDASSRGLLEEAEDLLFDVIDSGLELQAEHYNAVIRSCLPAGDTERAEKWLFRMQAMDVKPTVETYNALLEVAGGALNTQVAEQWFKAAYDLGLPIDARTYRAMLDVRRRVGDLSSVEIWFEHMMLAGVKPDIACCNSVIGSFSDAGQMRKVEEWLAITEENLQIPLNAESYNLAMAGYVASQDPVTAERLLEKMLRKGVQPTAESFALVIGNGTTFRELSTVERWSRRLLESGVDITPSAGAAVVGAFSGAGSVERAEEWYAQLVAAGKQSAEALELTVEALVLARRVQGLGRAEELVAEFRDAGLSLTPGVYAALASSDVLRGDFEQVEARLQQMESDGLQMDERSLSALLLAYANAQPQQSQLAEQMFKQQILQGRLQATREVLEALRAAVGGARCLALRRELQLGSVPSPTWTPPEKDRRLTEAGLRLVGLESRAAAPTRGWE